MLTMTIIGWVTATLGFFAGVICERWSKQSQLDWLLAEAQRHLSEVREYAETRDEQRIP